MCPVPPTLEVADQRAGREFLPVQGVIDEKAHELLRLRDGCRIFETSALEIDEREAAQFYRILRSLPPLGCGDRSSLDHVPVLASRLDRCARVRFTRELERESDF